MYNIVNLKLCLKEQIKHQNKKAKTNVNKMKYITLILENDVGGWNKC